MSQLRVLLGLCRLDLVLLLAVPQHAIDPRLEGRLKSILEVAVPLLGEARLLAVRELVPAAVGFNALQLHHLSACIDGEGEKRPRCLFTHVLLLPQISWPLHDLALASGTWA